MARYVLLRVDNDTEADELLEDLGAYPSSPLHTPHLHAPVHVELVAGIDPSDLGEPDLESPWNLIQASYERAYRLVEERERNQ